MIVSDNGTEFTCNAMLAWSEENKIDWHFKLQRPDAGRVAQRNPVLRPRSRPNKNYGLDRRLQQPASALVIGLSDTGGLCRQPHRNVRSAAQPRPAPPIARCLLRAKRPNIRRDSSRHWMKVQ